MIPNGSNLIDIGDDTDIENESEQPSYTYHIDFERGRIMGMIDELEAVRQAVYMILHTRRFYHVIFSWDYGIELDDLIGKSQITVETELEGIVKDALLADERVTDITGFKLEFISKRSATVEFTVVSIYGDISINEEVTI